MLFEATCKLPSSAKNRDQGTKMSKYLSNLDVKEFRCPRTSCRFKFFQRYTFLGNKLIIKVKSSNQVESLSTLIIQHLEL